MKNPAPPNTCRILYVDDNVEDQQILKEAINFADVPVDLVTASSARSALQLLSGTSTRFHILLVDWNLPAVTSQHFLEQLRSAYPSAPIIILTGEPKAVNISGAESLGVRAILPKPIVLEDWEQLAADIYRGCHQAASIAIA